MESITLRYIHHFGWARAVLIRLRPFPPGYIKGRSSALIFLGGSCGPNDAKGKEATPWGPKTNTASKGVTVRVGINRGKAVPEDCSLFHTKIAVTCVVFVCLCEYTVVITFHSIFFPVVSPWGLPFQTHHYYFQRLGRWCVIFSRISLFDVNIHQYFYYFPYRLRGSCTWIH